MTHAIPGGEYMLFLQRFFLSSGTAILFIKKTTKIPQQSNQIQIKPSVPHYPSLIYHIIIIIIINHDLFNFFFILRTGKFGNYKKKKIPQNRDKHKYN